MKKLVTFVAVSSALVLSALAVPAFAEGAAGYTLKVEAPPAKKGHKAVAKIHITPGAGFHMNKEYPTSLTLSSVPAGVTVDKTKQTMKDAAKWDETGGEFDVAYTAAQPGKKVVAGELKFAVCSTNTCDPKKSAISIDIDVK